MGLLVLCLGPVSLLLLCITVLESVATAGWLTCPALLKLSWICPNGPNGCIALLHYPVSTLWSVLTPLDLLVSMLWWGKLCVLY